ncbi:HpcH/HpaI aldolase/citrate lyase family protein [Salicibibacter kimchii]|uniref:CoA ester lyase n=1 Tax=Salicibibacter kimchii TaxID=2099786 RepID=A0A345BW84_9BACI|nr:CoA ester lyase [Salicibibacter kimchii]AXF55215.1 CoA ester lyase [Salicibibacter kimchii]
MKKHRTWLFAPGNHPRTMEKAMKTQTDIVIYDLEDAVPLDEKEQAREIVREHLQEKHIDKAPYKLLRVNESTSPFFTQDVIAGARGNVDGIVLPKSDHPEHIKDVDQQLAALEQELGYEVGKIQLFPLIESALGVHNSYEIAKASPRVTRLSFGAIDYTSDIQTKLSESGEELLYAQSQLVNSSYAAGIEGPIDTVYADFQNEEGLLRETQRGSRLGFKGKMIIHPKQIEVVHNVYTPGDEEVEEAKEIVNAYQQANEQGDGAIQLNGKMIDVPVVKSAQQTLDLVEALKETDDTKA